MLVEVSATVDSLTCATLCFWMHAVVILVERRWIAIVIWYTTVMANLDGQIGKQG